jgi:uncharacterized protein (DUF58 family)
MRAAVWLTGAFALAVAAATVVSLALFALAVGLLLVVVSAAAMVLLAAARVTVTRTVAEREVREDEPLVLRFGVRGLGVLPVRLVAMADDGSLVPLDECDETVRLTIGRRGPHRLEPTRLRLTDLFGIFSRVVLAGEPEPVLVLPVPDADAHIPVPPGAPAEDLDPDGLRPYMPGSPVGRIHWASLARGGELHERRYAAPPAGLPLVIVDTEGTDDVAEVDWVARAASGCVLRFARSGGCKVLLPGDEVPTEVTDAGGRHALDRRLAMLEGSRAGMSARPPGVGNASVVCFPAGTEAPQPPPLPPGVVPMPLGPAPPAWEATGEEAAAEERVP